MKTIPSLSQIHINLQSHTGTWTAETFWSRMTARVWSVILVCPWNWQETVLSDPARRRTLLSVRHVDQNEFACVVFRKPNFFFSSLHIMAPLYCSLPQFRAQRCTMQICCHLLSHTSVVPLCRWVRFATWPRRCWKEQWTWGTVSLH